MASTYLTRTPSSNGNQSKFTWSAWFKRSGLNNYENLFSSDVSATNSFRIKFGESSGDQKLDVYYYTGSFDFRVSTNRVFRDTNAWYHVVVTFDNQQSTSTDRIKIYVNGVRETSFSTSNFPTTSEGANSLSVTNAPMRLGATGVPDYYFDGLMSHVHFCDGYAYDASSFGSTDSTTGEWKINTSPSVTYGTNGFFLLKDDNAVTDRSGQGNNFTLGGGTLTKTEDNPSNVFATLNFLNKENGGSTLSNGNTKLVTTNQAGGPYTGRTTATLGASSGKYYWEVKPTSTVSSTYPAISVVGEDFIVMSGQNYLGGGSSSKSYITFVLHNGNISYNFTGSSTSGSYGNVVSANDIVGVALDLDNGKIFFSINGTWQNSGDPANGTNPANSNVGSLGGDIVFPALGDLNYSSSATFLTNFGNGYFGTTAVSSAGTNASGNGIFEYDVPTGYTALSTKGLNL